ncbi:hypothetical protein A0J61_08819 [Choanephora cucurbitarum]|uniref:Uncharacterized protein n=1 Tax=Choanephora cucurbitarum TaxID=101091 RepID=A0A1C7N1Z2_9FUNG|nr:hypothetical protein A0J61_08819 [Choanephora cucurbitarum]
MDTVTARSYSNTRPVALLSSKSGHINISSQCSSRLLYSQCITVEDVNSSKYFVLNSNSYTFYASPLLLCLPFSQLGVPLPPGSYMNALELAGSNTTKVL